MSDPQVPCVNCLTLAMCKARLDGGDLLNFLCLTDKCQPFQYFIYPSKDPKNKGDKSQPGYTLFYAKMRNFLASH